MHGRGCCRARAPGIARLRPPTAAGACRVEKRCARSSHRTGARDHRRRLRSRPRLARGDRQGFPGAAGARSSSPAVFFPSAPSGPATTRSRRVRPRTGSICSAPRRPGGRAPARTPPSSANAPSGSAVGTSGSASARAGGAGEDVDFLYRLLRAGARVRYEPDALVHHERQDAAKRRATRTSYGRGIGACCGLHLRRGDSGGLRMLGQWTALRGGMLRRALAQRDRQSALEELLVARGTAAGLIYGLRAAR